MKINFGPSPGYIVSLILHSISFYVGVVVFALRIWPPFLSSLQRGIPITGTHLTLLAFFLMILGVSRAFYIYHFTSYSLADLDSNPVLEIGRPYAFLENKWMACFVNLLPIAITA
ncbi:MAG: hypothetical protein R3F23_07000 [Verrucomicrobiia bacterium]